MVILTLVVEHLVHMNIDFVICTFRDREIQFYELSSFEPYCQISGLESVPLTMDYWYLFHSLFHSYTMQVMVVQFTVVREKGWLWLMPCDEIHLTEILFFL